MKYLIIVALFAVAAAEYGLNPDRPRWPRLPVAQIPPQDYDDSRVVGGHNADIRDYPYQIVLMRSGSFICGGSIINSNNILTAAHCVSGWTGYPDRFTIRSGSTNRLSGGTVTGVRAIRMHENYNSATIDNDVAILHLSSNLDLGLNTQSSVALATSGTYTGVNTVVTGWGTTTEGGSTTTTLQAAEYPVISNSQCQSQYSPWYTITDGMLCAYQDGGGVDACQGDSGGPLKALTDNRLVGVVSWGIGCARNGYAGVYARVTTYYSWIQSNMQ